MLDLSRPLGPIDGLTLYADHEQPGIVYYLPDEIDLRQLDADHPDIALQIFFPDAAVTGGSADLTKAVGSILELGARCTVSQARLDDVRSKLASQLGRDDFHLSLPPWEDGSVQLLLLDTATTATSTPGDADDRMVLGVVGSRRPSLSDTELTALFHARLDRRGTALTAAALGGQIGSVAGVLYDLTFAALRPTVNLRMSADLNRCADFFRAGVGVQVYYVGADISASFGKMREEGIIKVDLVSEASDPESERLVNESVKDFYDTLMRQLFTPTVSPAETLGAIPAGGSMQTSIVKFSFSYTHVEHERIVEVDYRKRSATRRTHNPQAHLRQLATLAGGVDRIVQRIPLSAAWREFEVEVAAPDAFNDATLRQARVVLWRGKDGVLPPAAARDGGLRMPAAAVPLADLALSKTDSAARRLAFVTQPDEPPFYRWQARFTYADSDEVDSPSEIWSDPHVSSSSDLDLFPDVLTPRHQTILKLGVVQNQAPVGVEARLTARNRQGQALAEHRIAVDAAHPDARWSIRRGESDQVTTEAELVYRYAGGASVTRPVQKLLDRELIANDPFMKTVTLAPLVIGAPSDLLEIVFVARYAEAASQYGVEVTRQLKAPDFRVDDLAVPVLNAGDKVSWEATAVRANGATSTLGKGDTPGGVINLIFSNTRRIRAEWLGPAPAALGLRWLRATFRARLDDGQVLDTATLEWRGAAVNGEQAVTLPRDGHAEWSIERRFEDGRKETTPFVAVDSDLLAVQG
ncbi:MAG TPA: hypothetical protein VN716_28350 [Vicinamibacterales bacterium]|nr:hypothetical protein [Vicinamibacterales bacterium]